MNEEGQENSGFEEKLLKAEKERDEYLAGWQRAKADFVNYKKDELKRLEEIARYGTEDLIYELITVIDNFDLALSYVNEKGPAPAQQSRSQPGGIGIEKGIYMIRSQISDILRKRGLEKIEVKIGDSFNPDVSEAIAETESDKPPGLIIEIIEPGYRLNGKIIRPARVKISKNK